MTIPQRPSVDLDPVAMGAYRATRLHLLAEGHATVFDATRAELVASACGRYIAFARAIRACKAPGPGLLRDLAGCRATARLLMTRVGLMVEAAPANLRADGLDTAIAELCGIPPALH